MSDYIYGKGGKTKGKRCIKCGVCGARRYIDPSDFDADARHICGHCWEQRSEEIPSPPYEARLVAKRVQLGDEWRPNWYSYQFVPVGTLDDFFVDAVGWENLQPVERPKFLSAWPNG